MNAPAPHRSLIVIFLLLSGAGAPAQESPRGFISLVSENDIYAPSRQDRHYSNGVRLGYGLGDEPGRWYSWMDGISTLDDPGVTRRHEIAVGQNIYTPEWFRNPLPLPNDRPYAGWLYSEISVTSNAPGMEEGIVLNAGIIGPAALGEEMQKLNHRAVGDPEPAGWDHQLGNEPALLFRYRRSWFVPLFQAETVQADLIPRLGTSLGNVFTDIGTGLVVRFGNHLPEREIPLRIQPGLSGTSSAFEVREQRFDWMLFGEVQGRAVVHNVFLDGNTFRDSLSVEKREVVWDAATGVILGFGQFGKPVFFSFSFVWRGREFDLQKGSDSFGSALIGVQF